MSGEQESLQSHFLLGFKIEEDSWKPLVAVFFLQTSMAEAVFLVVCDPSINEL
jgi:hypothetical protein